MFIDARQIEDGAVLQSDLCILGAGASGIAIARDFRHSGISVCLVESGGLDYDAENQRLYEAENLGLQAFDPSHDRLRYFGGATNHWGGYCTPFDAIDFEPRPWIPHSGWPFPLGSLIPYYRRAAELVEIPPFEDFDLPTWEVAAARHGERVIPPLNDPAFHPKLWQNSPPTRFNERYRDDLAADPDLRVLLYANLVGAERPEGARELAAVELAVLGGSRFTLAAKRFVIACGAIENARILLTLRDQHGALLVADNPWVGACFMEHPWFEDIARFLPSGPLSFPPTSERLQQFELNARLDEALQREHRLPNIYYFLDARPYDYTNPGIRSAGYLIDSLRHHLFPDDLLGHIGNIASHIDRVGSYSWRRLSGEENLVGYFDISVGIEQRPNLDSRVQLVDDFDALGIQRAALNWQMEAADREALVQALDILGRRVGASGLGRLQSGLNPDGSNWLDFMIGSHHHMGTTRMSDDPSQGVTDPTCRLHGLGNVYVTGGGLFPSSSVASPTYTIVALALRLANHLKTTFAT